MLPVCHMLASLPVSSSSSSLLSPPSPHLPTLSVVTRTRGQCPVLAAAAWRLRGPVPTGRWWRGGRVPTHRHQARHSRCCWHRSNVATCHGQAESSFWACGLSNKHFFVLILINTDINSSDSSCCVGVYEVSRNNAFRWYGMLHGSCFCLPSYAAHKKYSVSMLGEDETKVDTTRSVSAESGVRVSLQTQSPWVW